LNQYPNGLVKGANTYQQILEAEDGLLDSFFKDKGSYIITTRGNDGEASYEFSVPEAGDYQVEFKAKASKSNTAELDVSINGSNTETLNFYNSGEGSFAWKADVYVTNLAAGSHTLLLEGNDKNLQIDQIRITSDVQAGPGNPTNPTNPTGPVNPGDPIGPTPGVDRENLLNNVVGFGQGTTGGRGGSVCMVTNLQSSGSGSLKGCAENQRTWVMFDVSGTITLSSPLSVANDVTIDGRGADITVTGRGINVSNRNNVIIHNIKVKDVDDDALKVYNSNNVWIDHVTLEDAGDGLLDITAQSYNVTVSWSHFRDHNKTMLIGANNSHVEDEVITVTLHHNLFENTVRRNPFLRFGSVHMYNNVLRNWGEGAGGGDAVNSTYGSQILLENNVFVAGNNKVGVRNIIPKWAVVPGYVNAVGNLALNGADVQSFSADNVFTASNLYSYTLAVANQNLITAVDQYVGWQATEPPQDIGTDPGVTPTPNPDPTPEPEPTPNPDPTPDPDPEPEPTPNPDPTPDPEPEPTPNPDPTPDPEPTPISNFDAGDQVQSMSNLNVRNPYGLSGAVAGTQNIGSIGTVLDVSPQSADAYVWVLIDFVSGGDGWVADEFLTEYTVPTPDPDPTPIPDPVTDPLPTPIKDASGALIIEAEWGEVIAPMNIGGNYISSETERTGSAEYIINVTESGKIIIELSAHSKDEDSDLVYLSIDGERKKKLKLYESEESDGFVWKEDDYDRDLNPGEYTILIEAYDSDLKIDAIRITADEDQALPEYIGNTIVVPTNPPVVDEPNPDLDTPLVSNEVETTDVLNVRATANGDVIGQQPKGAEGLASEVQTTIGAYTWVYVDFETGTDGYVANDFLIAENIVTPSPDISVRAALIAQIQSLLLMLDDLRAQLAAMQEDNS
jgi:pectate lyase